MKCLYFFILFSILTLRSATLKIKASGLFDCDAMGDSNSTQKQNIQDIKPVVSIPTVEPIKAPALVRLLDVPAIDIGANFGKVFICGADRKIYELNQDQNYYTPFSGVKPPIPCSIITVDIQGNPWIANEISEGGNLYRYRTDNNSWEKVISSKPVLDIACSKLSDCFLLNSLNDLYRISLSDNKMLQIEPNFVKGIKLDASSINLCHVGVANGMWCRGLNLNTGTWDSLGSQLFIDTSICKNGKVYAVGTDKSLYVWNGKWDIQTNLKNITKTACDNKLWYLSAGIAKS